MVGEGLFFHMKQFMSLLWPEIHWNKWSELQLDCWTKYRIIGQIGCASSGKSMVPACCLLADYYCFPDSTTGLVSSTTRESLEMRILGELKKYHKLAKKRRSWIPGYLIEGRQRIVTDPRNESSEGRDFRNGIVGVACKRGQAYQGIEEYVGIKNKHLRLLSDELQFLPRVFVDSIANLNKNTDFKCVGSGNPKDTTDALGVLCEPAAHLGGWDGGIDQTPGTKTWEIRFPQGICIQLPGSDSPNLDGKLGIPLITKQQIDADIAFYGKDSIQYTMMDEGRMPRGMGNRRVLTRNMCVRYRAMEEPMWMDSRRTKIAFLDAAYGGVGGDRCVFGVLEYGKESEPDNGDRIVSNLINQTTPAERNRQIVALISTEVIPVSGERKEDAEEQIALAVKDRCERLQIPPGQFFFDSGMRTGLVSALARLWSAYVCPVDCGGKPSEDNVSEEINIPCDKYYSKFITELWFNVRKAVESQQWRGLTEDVISEFCQREWRMVTGNRIEVEPKADMKLKIGRSPDLADAVAVGLYGARQMGFKIVKSSKTVSAIGKIDPSWKRQIKEKAHQLWRAKELSYR